VHAVTFQKTKTLVISMMLHVWQWGTSEKMSGFQTTQNILHAFNTALRLTLWCRTATIVAVPHH
jgi:hypothetical protein